MGDMYIRICEYLSTDKTIGIIKLSNNLVRAAELAGGMTVNNRVKE